MKLRSASFEMTIVYDGYLTYHEKLKSIIFLSVLIRVIDVNSSLSYPYLVHIYIVLRVESLYHLALIEVVNHDGLVSLRAKVREYSAYKFLLNELWVRDKCPKLLITLKVLKILNQKGLLDQKEQETPVIAALGV